MKILTILGTRPEIIRLSLIIQKLDELCDHRVLHTGQNYDPNLGDVFFEEMNIGIPDVILDNRTSNQGEQIGNILSGTEEMINEFQPDKVLILGDTNSGLAGLICRRKGIPVYHMEAGNRCYDQTVPEEANRKIIDSVSTINLPYTEFSRQNLLREGYDNNKIFISGNPIKEVITHYESDIESSTVLERYGVTKGNYIIATAHRAENVDNEERLRNIFEAFAEISKEYKIIFSCHPRTRQKLEKFNISCDNIIMTEPMGFFDFVKLEKNSLLAISDSGTVQEEMCLFRIPTITIRETTERPETVMCGSNLVSGLEKESIMKCYEISKQLDRNWPIPEEYDRDNVSDVVISMLFSNLGVK